MFDFYCWIIHLMCSGSYSLKICEISIGRITITIKIKHLLRKMILPCKGKWQQMGAKTNHPKISLKLIIFLFSICNIMRLSVS